MAAASSQLVSEAGFAALQAERAVQDVSVTQQLSREYAGMVATVREVFDSGRTKDLAWRRRQLEALIKGIQENSKEIVAAVGADLGGAKMRAVFEMGLIVGDAEHALSNLTAWTTPVTKRNDLVVDIHSHYTVRPEPKGVTLNVAPWNFPFAMHFQPMVAAVAAGNCMIIKPSEMAPHCAELSERIVNKYLDTDCIKIVQGAVAETTALLEQHWDHIFYTGNGVVGRIILEAAAKHLTPCTLELGGKSPVLVDKTANMATVVNRVFAAKTANQGQVCISPDYVLIDESRAEEFISAFAQQVEASNFGAGSKSNPNWGKIINSRHAQRLKRLIDTSGGTVVCGGSADVDTENQHVPVTVIKNVAPNAPIMHEEIFGPLLPVVPVKSMDEGMSIIKNQDRPLALYIFSEDKAFQEKALTECTSGGACVNTALDQVVNKEVPFGGTGASGMGKYHGKYGFDEFSHYRTVLYKSGSSATLPHPEHQPAWLADVAEKALVTGFLSPEAKFQAKALLGAVGGICAGALALSRSRL